ncbi:MAG: GNAT family N-acetyltransferase [Aquabacterium sp.]|nr:GNAT family N-acetyltransferase [Aquabacterium sp.]
MPTSSGPASPRARRAPSARPSTKSSARSPNAIEPAVVVRPVRNEDIEAVIGIDTLVTGHEKRAYWRSVFRRYGTGLESASQFLVADHGGEVLGFVIGEVRDWEFGSPPCGWVFVINVTPKVRQTGVGAQLLEAVCAGFRREGVRTVRTILARENTLILSFFRSQGMTTGPFIPLEMSLES